MLHGLLCKGVFYLIKSLGRNDKVPQLVLKIIPEILNKLNLNKER